MAQMHIEASMLLGGFIAEPVQQRVRVPLRLDQQRGRGDEERERASRRPAPPIWMRVSRTAASLRVGPLPRPRTGRPARGAVISSTWAWSSMSTCTASPISPVGPHRQPVGVAVDGGDCLAA